MKRPVSHVLVVLAKLVSKETRHLRELPSNIILGVQTLTTLLETGKVTGGHHAGPIPRRARHREWPRDLLLDTRDEVLLLVTNERVRISPPEGQLTSFDVLETHALPVKKVTQTLSPVALVDTLTAALLRELKHVLGKLIDRIFDTLGTTIDDVDAIVARILDQLFHVAAETRKVGGDAGNTHDSAFSRCVAPRLIVGREDAEVSTADKVVIIERQDRAGRVQELGMEDNLDAVAGMVEQLYSADLVQDRVVMVINHVVCDNWRQPVPLHGEQTPAQQHTILAREKFLIIRHGIALLPLQGPLEDATTDILLNCVHSIPKGLDDSLALQSLDRQRVCLSGHDDESNNGHLAVGGLEPVI